MNTLPTLATNDATAALSRWVDRLALRSTLSAEEHATLLALPGLLETIQPNRDFVRLGEHVDKACLVVSGLAGRFGQTRSGARQITALHLPGDMADLHSVVLPTSGSALQSIGEAVIYRVPHVHLRAAMSAFPALAEIFWRDCEVDAAVLSQWALRNGRLTAVGRVAHLLAEMACRLSLGQGRDGLAFDWPLTQAHLSDATGLTPVHVNRMMRTIREAGAADVRDRRLQILSWDTLRALGEFDARYLQLGLAV